MARKKRGSKGKGKAGSKARVVRKTMRARKKPARSRGKKSYK